MDFKLRRESSCLHDNDRRPGSSNVSRALHYLTIHVIGKLCSSMSMMKKCSRKILRHNESYRETILASSESIWAFHDFESETDNLQCILESHCMSRLAASSLFLPPDKLESINQDIHRARTNAIRVYC